MEEWLDYHERTEGMSHEERVREIAHQLWLQQGKPQGRDLEIWIAAEKAFAKYYPWNPYAPHNFDWQL